jgi:hypothetical protein
MPVTVSGHKAQIHKVFGGNLSHLLYINPNLTYVAFILFNPFPVTEKKKVTQVEDSQYFQLWEL